MNGIYYKVNRKGQYKNYMNGTYTEMKKASDDLIIWENAFDDELIAYANRTIHLITEADFQKQLDRISDGATTQEYKDLYRQFPSSRMFFLHRSNQIHHKQS